MRRIHFVAPWFAAVFVIALFFGVPCQAKAEGVPQVVRVLQVKGHARCSTDNKTWQPLKKDDVLPPGVMIQTAPKSAVDLQLGDENAAPTSIDSPNGGIATPEELKANTIRVYENSVLTVGALASVRAGETSETQLDLRTGRIMGAVRKTATASRYEIKFSKGVAGIRNGVYLLNSSGLLDVLYGTALVALESADGSPVKMVTANQQFDPGTGAVQEIRNPLPIEPLGPTPTNSSPSPAPAKPPQPFQGQGMGGSLRKF